MVLLGFGDDERSVALPDRAAEAGIAARVGTSAAARRVAVEPVAADRQGAVAVEEIAPP